MFPVCGAGGGEGVSVRASSDTFFAKPLSKCSSPLTVAFQLHSYVSQPGLLVYPPSTACGIDMEGPGSCTSHYSQQHSSTD
jgi:hypothetical protein